MFNCILMIFVLGAAVGCIIEFIDWYYFDGKLFRGGEND